mmetsp:Transcript_21869/g.33207  ORF Transcript_21869/g.33207 Transcript_21869/m.33207 type:complete len:383 (-) Transcript_21869:406-1554(-)
MRCSPVAKPLVFAFSLLLIGDVYQPCVSFQATTSILRSTYLKASTNSIETGSSSLQTQLEEEISFVSRPMPLYIEDTDAYGVMYNGNYIKSYERALYEFHTKRKKREKKGSFVLVLDDSDFHLTRCTSHKFKSSPTLGSRYVIKGALVNNSKFENSNNDDELLEETWSLEMIEYKDPGKKKYDDNKPATVYNTALVTITAPTTKKSECISSFNNSDDDKEEKRRLPMLTKVFTIHRDEFDVHMPGVVPLSTTLSLFERTRSDSLGGPYQLRRMQEEDNLLWVVTSLDDLQIDDTGNKCVLQPGDELHVSMYCTVKRKGMIIVCDQEIWVRGDTQKNINGGVNSDNDDDSIVLAKGTCTICAIDSIRGRPTSNIPERVKALFQ